MIRKHFHFVVLLATLILVQAISGRCQTLGSETQDGKIVDRVVATVNGNAILQSDWEDAIRYEAFIDHRPLDNFGSDDRKASLDRLIDQELLREQVQASYIEPVKSAAVDEHI